MSFHWPWCRLFFCFLWLCWATGALLQDNSLLPSLTGSLSKTSFSFHSTNLSVHPCILPGKPHELCTSSGRRRIAEWGWICSPLLWESSLVILQSLPSCESSHSPSTRKQICTLCNHRSLTSLFPPRNWKYTSDCSPGRKSVRKRKCGLSRCYHSWHRQGECLKLSCIK